MSKESEVEELRNIIKHYIDDDKDLDNVMGHIKKLKSPASGLVPLDNNAKEYMGERLCQWMGRVCAYKVAQEFISKFGTKPTLSEQELDDIIIGVFPNQLHKVYSLRNAIIAALTKGEL